MTTTYNRNGDGTGTFTLEITASQDRLEEVLYNFALTIFLTTNGTKTEFDALTTNQQLFYIELFLKKVAIARDKDVQERTAIDTLNIQNPDW